MAAKTWLEGFIERHGESPDFMAAGLLIPVMDELYRRAEALGLTQRGLADRLGKSQAYVSKVLTHRPNLTMRSLVRLANALELRVAGMRLVDKSTGWCYADTGVGGAAGDRVVWGQAIRPLYEQVKDSPDFLAERLLLPMMEEVWRRMHELGLTQRQLAERLGKSQAYVARILNHHPNMTMRSLVELANALDLRVDGLRFVEKESGRFYANTGNPQAAMEAEFVPDLERKAA